MSLLTRSVSFVLVLPLILKKFSDTEAAVWFVFSAVMIVQSILGFGFSPSFARLLAYARAGADVAQMHDLRDNRAIGKGQGCDWVSIARLCSCMRRVFFGLSVLNFLVLAGIGTLAVYRTVVLAGNLPSIWVAWVIMVISSSFNFATTYYSSFLQGMDKLTESRRLDTVLALCSILTAFGVLTWKASILALVLSYQIWVVVGFFAYRAMAFRLVPKESGWSQDSRWEPFVLRLVWDSAWKNGVTNCLTFGLVQSTGVLQAQFSDPSATVAYNFNLRLVTLIGQVVQAPFLTRLPELARLRALGQLGGQLQILRRCISMTHWLILTSTLLVAMILPTAISIMGCHSLRFNPVLWAFFSISLVFERHSAMLQSIRNLTNNPKEHIAMIGYFFFNVAFMSLLFRCLHFGMYSFPIAMIATQLFFVLWYSASVSYPILGVSALSFELGVSLPPVLIVIVVNLFIIYKKFM